MNDNKQFDNPSNRDSEHLKLARWLRHVLAQSPQDTANVSTSKEDEVVTNNDYHPRFYRQLPDFIMALLQNEAKATVHYAPLLYHLAGCTMCHNAYLELYDALRYAVKPGEKGPGITSINYGSRPLSDAATVKLCQLLIGQAEAVLRQARLDHTDGDAQARSLLQWAMRMSAHIMQNGMRARALRDLVRVATITDDVHSSEEQGLASRSYAPVIGASGTRHGKTLRKADVHARSTGTPAEQAVIYLQSSPLDGNILQREGVLELHLHDLDEKLRGRYLTISVPLGSLIEPVRWIGGNPRTIRTEAPVDKDGTLITPLGETDLRLSNPDERNLLEVMFLLLEVRPVS